MNCNGLQLLKKYQNMIHFRTYGVVIDSIQLKFEVVREPLKKQLAD